MLTKMFKHEAEVRVDPIDSVHRPDPMSSRQLSPCPSRWLQPCCRGHGRMSRSLSRRDRTWCHHQIGFVGSVLSWWTSRDHASSFGLCPGRFELYHGQRGQVDIRRVSWLFLTILTAWTSFGAVRTIRLLPWFRPMFGDSFPVDARIQFSPFLCSLFTFRSR